MDQAKVSREFSMRYCPNLDDRVVVMQKRMGDTQQKICLCAHLCHTDMRMSCGHDAPFSVKTQKDSVTM